MVPKAGLKAGVEGLSLRPDAGAENCRLPMPHRISRPRIVGGIACCSEPYHQSRPLSCWMSRIKKAPPSPNSRQAEKYICIVLLIPSLKPIDFRFVRPQWSSLPVPNIPHCPASPSWPFTTSKVIRLQPIPRLRTTPTRRSSESLRDSDCPTLPSDPTSTILDVVDFLLNSPGSPVCVTPARKAVFDAERSVDTKKKDWANTHTGVPLTHDNATIRSTCL
jgi:hypothetical protein